MIIFALFTAWLIWKLYPTLKAKGGLKKLLQPTPFITEDAPAAPAPEKQEPAAQTEAPPPQEPR